LLLPVQSRFSVAGHALVRSLLIVWLAVFAAPATAAAQERAQILFPNEGESVPRTEEIRWNSVASAQAYYLYVGTTPGAKDLIDTGETPRLSVPLGDLPRGVTLYARLHTKTEQQWRFVDRSFSIQPSARFTTPSEPGLELDVRDDMISWTTVNGAHAYYLYVGATPGANDLINTGEIQRTTQAITSLPVGRAAYASIYTKVADRWFVERTDFTTRPVAYFTYPHPPAMEVDVRSDRLTWTSVEGAQAYYLYVGTTLGANDLINSGETLETSYPADMLPVGETLYARLYTKHGDRWRSTDTTIVTRPIAYFTKPASPDVELDVVDDRISWTSLADAQAYYLYVGTTPGAKDLIDSGETLRTSLSIASLPAGRRVYARLYTKSGDRWRSVDTAFVTRPVAYVTNIAANETDVDVHTDIRWTIVDGAEAYYLYAGSSPGRNDLINTGEIDASRFPLVALAGAQRIYVTLYTKWDGRWRATSTSFTTSAASRLVDPMPGTTISPFERTVQWNGTLGASAYRLEIGSTLGASDVFSSPILSDTRTEIPSLPAGDEVYLRLWTFVNGQWISSDSAISTVLQPALVTPRLGALGVPALTTVEWNRVVGADEFRLFLGSSLGAADYLDSGPTNELALDSVALPAESLVYARIHARVAGQWLSSDSIFTTESTPTPAELLTPTPGQQTGWDAGYGFEWTHAPLARSYELKLGSSRGTDDIVHASGLRATRRIVRNLPAGATLYGTLTTHFYDGSAQSQDFSFSVAQGLTGVDADDALAAGLWATAWIRGMADADNQPDPTSVLADLVRARGNTGAFCTDYSAAMFDVMTDVGADIPLRYLNVCLNPNGFDCHTLIEAYYAPSDRWIVLDPTFGMTVGDAQTAKLAAASDIHQAVRNLAWDSVDYLFLTNYGDQFATSYYLDYPLLYLNVYLPDGSGYVTGDPPSVSPYFEYRGSSVSGAPDAYALQCPLGKSSVSAAVDGRPLTLQCTSPDRFTRVFHAGSVSAQDGGADPLAVFRALRFAF
jgi:hypothetical protein